MMEDEIKGKIIKREYSIDVLKTHTFSEESIDMNLFEKIINNIDSLQDLIGFSYDVKKNERIDWTGTKTILIDTFKKRQKNLSILYAPTKSSMNGRHFSKVPSLQGMARKVRHVLCKGNHIDIDCKNCHPVILTQICDAYGFNCDKINFYIENRDKCIKELINITNSPKDDVKQWLLSLLNGGNSYELFNYPNIPDWVKDFKTQIKMIHEQFSNLPEFKPMYKKIEKSYGIDGFNLKGKLMNKIMCMYENTIIQHVIHFMKSNNIEVISNQFDGVLIKKHENINDEFLLKVQKFILDNVGIKIELIIKPMDEGDKLREALEFLLTKKEQKEALKRDKQNEKDRERHMKEEERLERERIKEERKRKLPELSDVYLATHFLDRIGDIILFSKKLNAYYLFNEENLLWEDVPFERISTLFSHFLIEFLDELISKSTNDINIEKYEDYKVKVCNTSTQKDLLFQVRNHIQDKSKFIDKVLNFAETLFPFGCNVIDFSTGKIRPRLKEDYFSMTTDNEYITDYNKDWIETYFKDLLMTDDPEYIKIFSLLLSSFLTTDTTIKKIMTFIGEPNSGKSVLLLLIRSVFGDFHITAPKRLFIQSKSESVLQTELPPLIYRRVATISELEDTDKFNEGLIKNISGGDPVQCREDKTYNEILLTSKLLMISNYMPMTKDKALRDRLLCINFKNSFSKSSEKAKEILSMKNHLFSYLCDYAIQLVDLKYKIEPSPQMIEFKKNIFEDQYSSSKEFIKCCIEFTSNPKDRIKKPQMFTIYNEFCIVKNQEKDKRGDFYKELALEPYNLCKDKRYIKTGGEEYFTNIKIRTNWQIEDNLGDEEDITFEIEENCFNLNCV